MSDTPAKDKENALTAKLMAAAEASARATPGKPESLVRALEQYMSSVVSDQLTAMLDSADEILFEMAEKAGNGADQRLYFDALRVIRIERARMLRSFQDNLQHAFADSRTERAAAGIDLDDVDSWSVQGSDETEEGVAVANLESKAASMYQKELYELENRLETMAEKSPNSVSPKLVAPAKIFDAFRHTMKGLEVEFPIKLVIYRLAERSLLGNLGQVYTGANQMLAQHGYAPASPRARLGAPSPRSDASSGGAGAAGGGASQSGGYGGGASSGAGAMGATGGGPAWGSPAPGAGGFSGGGAPNWGAAADSGSAAWPSGLSASRLLDGLSGVAGSNVSAQAYTDGQLANDIGAALDAMSQGRPYSSWMPQANLALSGQMFDSLYQDRQLPETLRPLLKRLQFPVMKTALSDPGFFKSSQHPVRNLVHEIFDMLASADAASEGEVQRLADLIEYLVRQFEVAPERLNKPENRAPAVSEDQAEEFLAEQKARQAGQRGKTLEKVRRLVAQELKLRTATRAVPESVMPLLLSGFGPLLAVNALRGGIHGIPWKESIALLERLLASIEPHKLPSLHQSAEEADIVTSVTERLIGIGLSHEKVQKLVAALLDIYQTQALELAVAPVVGMTSSHPAMPATPVTPQISPEAQAAANAQQALTAILVIGSWFQVWDAPNDQRRWLKLHAYIPARDMVVFDDFMGENHLRLPASSLIRDLIESRSAPVDPSPAVQRSLKLLGPLSAMLPVSSELAVWQPAATTLQ